VGNVVDIFKNTLKEPKEGKIKPAHEDEISILNMEQIQRIFYEALISQEEKPPSEEDLISILCWARETTIRVGILNLIYQGEVKFKWCNKEKDLIVEKIKDK